MGMCVFTDDGFCQQIVMPVNLHGYNHASIISDTLLSN